MLALHQPDMYLDQLFVAPNIKATALGRQLLAFTRQLMPDEIFLRCVRENEKARRWYEREDSYSRRSRSSHDGLSEILSLTKNQ
jgi:acetylglutamate synthase